MENNVGNNAETLREIGKTLFFHHNGDDEKRSQGLDCLVRAYLQNDPEASYLVATLILYGVLKPAEGDPEDFALDILCRLADRGDVLSRNLLNRVCLTRSDALSETVTQNAGRGELVDHEGKPIRISRRGLLTPIDAELVREGEKNVLKLSANILFLYLGEFPDRERFEEAVLDGMRAWQGTYTVFGGQSLTVEVGLTREPRLFDSVTVYPITSYTDDYIRRFAKALGTETNRKSVDLLLDDKRSFAISGRKWTAHSRKIICIQRPSGDFSDLDEIRDIARHEFGHALGLGDLYCSEKDGLPGVEKGTYAELDCFCVSPKRYNLVMCDHHGPIGNNDIEMVLLAFRDNVAQLYQPGLYKGRISAALGTGN